MFRILTQNDKSYYYASGMSNPENREGIVNGIKQGSSANELADQVTHRALDQYYNGSSSGQILHFHKNSYKADTTKMTFEAKLEHVENLQAGEFGILRNVVIHIFDS